MNYKDYQKLQDQSKEKPVHQSRPDKSARQSSPKNDKLWNFLSEAANPSQLLTILTMVIFGFAKLPEIPAVFCFITFALFIIRSQRKKSFEWLSIIWLFNAIIWSFNSIFLR
jgi:hypothetical protein